MTTPINQHVSNEKKSDKPIGFVAAVAVHAVLLAGLVSVFQWNTDSESFYAELWAPQDASGTDPKGNVAEVQEESSPSEEPTPPKPTAEELAQAEKQARDLQLAQQQEQKRARLEEQARQKLVAEQKAIEERRLAELEAQKAEEIRIAEEKRIQRERAERKRRAEELRRAELARITGATPVESGRVGSTKGTPGVTQRNIAGKLSASYKARIAQCIRGHISYRVPSSVRRGEHIAIYQVHLLPDGHQAGKPKQLKTSGIPAFDSAVESAIVRCDPFPRPSDHSAMPRVMEISFDPVDDAN